MEPESQELLESLMPEMDSQSILNFPQNNFGVPEQMFADSSSSETCIEEVVIGPDIATSDSTIVDSTIVALTEPNKIITSGKSQSEPISCIPQQLAAPPLRIAAVPVNSEVLKQGNNKLFLIPMGDMDPSLLQSSLKVPSGQNIIIVKPQDLINSVEEKKLKLKTQSFALSTKQHGVVLQQTKNVNQDNVVVVNKKQSGQATLVQAQTNLHARAPNQVGTNLQANQGSTQPKIVVQMLNTSEEVDSKVGNLEPQEVVQSSQLEMATPQHISLSKNVPANQASPYSKTSQSQPVANISQQIQIKTGPQTGSKQNLANPGIQVQKVGQSMPVTAAILIQAQKSIPSTSSGATSCKPLSKVSQGIQTHPNKGTVLTQPKARGIPVKSVNKVSQGMQTVPQQNVQLGQAKTILQVPKSLQGSYFKVTSATQRNALKVTTTTTQRNAESKIQSPLHQTPKLPQAIPIVRPTNPAGATPIKSISVFSQSSAEKIPSSTPVAAPKLQSHTPSVWPSTKQLVVNLESGVIEAKPRSGRPHNNESTTAEKSKITKTDSQKGPTLLTELEKRSFNSSVAARIKTARPGESQLKPIKHTKVSSTNPWRCSLCGKSSFENSLGCLFGPYDENKDALQAESQSPGRKRRRNSTSEEPESPTKSKPESNSTQEFWFHGDCIIWSPGVCAVGESLAGYKQAVNDSRFRKCTFCGNFGASLVCLQRTCKKLYHFPCAKGTECTFEDSNYTMQCGHHK